MSENVLTNQESDVSLSSTASQKIKKVILALQHLVAMFGATVLVPMITGFDASVALFCAGLGTLLFHFVTKKKVPVFLGSSFAFIPAILTVKSMYNGDLTYAQGGIVVAGLVYVGVSFVIKKVGVKKIEKYLPPQVVGPMIMVIGLSLIPTAYSNASQNFILAAVTLGTALIINFFAKGILKQLGILIGVATGYIVAYAAGGVDTTVITNTSIISMPNFTLPKFSLGAIITIVPIVLAVFMEHIGDITTNGQVVGENFIDDPGLDRTLLGDGLATMAAAFLGGPANTTYGENTSVLAITKNYDPSILRLAAVFAIIIGFVSKIGGVLNSIPVPVMGGISLMLFSMISLIGVKTIKNNKVEMNYKNIIIIVTMLILGLGNAVTESKFGFTLGIKVSDTVKISGTSFAAIVGILLNAVLNRKTIK